jgi:hypothetical protein
MITLVFSCGPIVYFRSKRSSLILLAEDLESDILLLQRALRQARIVNPVKVVNDGEQAIAYLKGTVLSILCLRCCNVRGPELNRSGQVSNPKVLR